MMKIIIITKGKINKINQGTLAVGCYEIYIKKKKEKKGYLRVVKAVAEAEISAIGMWKASDHDNWLRHVAVGVPQR